MEREGETPVLLLYEGLFCDAFRKGHDSLILNRLVGMDTMSPFDCEFDVISQFAKSLIYCDMQCVILSLPEWKDSDFEKLKHMIDCNVSAFSKIVF